MVSVYMPTQGLRPLLPTINSVLEQDYNNIELIIAYDSTRSPPSELQDLLSIDDRIRLVTNTREKGACGARNSAIMTAKGTYVTGIDDDDLMIQGRISTMVSGWDDQYALVFCGHIRRFQDLDQQVPIHSVAVTSEQMLHRNIIGNQVLTRLDYIKGAGLFDEALPAYQDFDMWVRLMREYGSAKGIDSNNYVFMQSGNDRISGSKTKRRSAWLKFIKKHRPWLSVRQRQSLALLIYKEQWKHPSYKRLLTFANCSNWRLIALMIRRRLFAEKWNGID